MRRRQRRGCRSRSQREDRASDDPGDDQREDDFPEGPPSSSPEIRRSLQQGARNAFERRVDRQDHVGEPEVTEDDPDRDQGGSDRHVHPGLSEEPFQQPPRGQDQLPREDPDEVVGPERQHDRDQHRRPAASGSKPRGVVRHREPEHDVGQRHRRRDACRPQDHVSVHGHVDDPLEVRKGELLHDEPGERIQVPEGRRVHNNERPEIDHEEPQAGGAEQPPEPQAGVTEQECRDTGSRPGRSVGFVAHHVYQPGGGGSRERQPPPLRLTLR